MILNDKEKATLGYYNSHAEEWVQDRHPGDTSFWQKELEHFHELLKAGKVLEIGTGSGREAAILLKYGYDYTGIDASIGLLDIARKNLPRGKFLHQTFYELNFPENSFDGFWTSATLLHVPKGRIEEVLLRIKHVIKPNAVGFISLKQGTGESVEESTGRLFSYYSVEEFNRNLNKVGLSLIEEPAIRPKDKRGNIWLTYFVRK